MSVADVKPGYEKVFTVTDYYDGPRQGVANFKGEPHFYDCIFDETRNDYSNLYQLTPVSPQVFDLAMEDWAIWERWESAFHAGSRVPHSFAHFANEWARRAVPLAKLLHRTRFDPARPLLKVNPDQPSLPVVICAEAAPSPLLGLFHAHPSARDLPCTEAEEDGLHNSRRDYIQKCSPTQTFPLT
jgi:hypothetical protein